MTPERWQKVDELFQAAIELAPDKRVALLDNSCAGDEELRREVESLITADEQGLSVVEEPAFQVAAGLLASGEPALVDGQSFGHYEILGLIGRGGMGEVYLAKDRVLNRSLALKLLPADYTKHKDRLRRFQQEAQAASALNHPNILTIYELGQVEGQQFMATEFVEGETLRQLMKRSRLSLSDALDIAAQTAGALAAAHRAGIVHRDIKPENIMLRPDGYVKLLDFGLAKLTEQDEPTSLASGEDRLDISSGLVMGTIKYMSPEQAQAQVVDQRSDIFSLGVVLYEMFADRAPFDAKTAADLIVAILEREPEPLSDLPEALQGIISKTLCKEREERYQSAEDLLIDLKNSKIGQEAESSVQSAESTVRQRAMVGGMKSATTGQIKTVDTTPSLQYLSRQMQRRKLGASLVLAALAVAAVGFGLYKFAKPRRAALSFQNLQVTRFTTSGHAWSPAISPDGKYVVFGSVENGKVSLLLKQIGNSEPQSLSTTEGNRFWGAAFSPDGEYVYYSIIKDFSNRAALYRISTSGGTPIKLPIDLDGRVSVSPDGKRLAYVRIDKNQSEKLLLTANEDGTDERIVLTQKLDHGCEYCNDVSWSPDGTSIACAGFPTDTGKARLMEVNVLDGTERTISSPEWSHIVFLAWFPDKSGLIVVAASEHTGPQQIWHLTYPAGVARKLTNDVGSYEGIGLSADGKTLIAAQLEVESRVWTATVDPNNLLITDLNRAKQVSLNRFEGRSGLAFAPDGRIVYSSKEGDRDGIWIMDANGENRKQLTDQGIHPAVSSDGQYIVFQSTKDGFIWRMDTDGGNLKQLADGGYPSISPDSKWVLYNHSQMKAWKVSIEGGEPIQIVNTPAHMPRLSPDGKLLAYGYWAKKNEPRLAISPAEGGQPIKTFVLASGFSVYNWTSDAKALTFCASKDQNIWIQPIEGGPPHKLADLSPSNIIYNAWSADGRQLAFVRTTPVRDVILINDLQ